MQCNTGAYSEPFKHLRWSFLRNKLKLFKLLKAVFARTSFLDVWQGSEYTSDSILTLQLCVIYVAHSCNAIKYCSFIFFHVVNNPSITWFSLLIWKGYFFCKFFWIGDHTFMTFTKNDPFCLAKIEGLIMKVFIKPFEPPQRSIKIKI